MGATITVGKRACAFRNTQGEIIYVLFERTYEKNVYPHTPSWGCVSIGTYEEVMRFVFLAMTSCESGMLKNSHGDIEPRNYLRAWMRELMAPCAIEGELEIKLAISTSFKASLPEEKLSWAVERLRKGGLESLASMVEQREEVTLQLARDSFAIRLLFGFGAELGPWRIIPGSEMRAIPVPELGHKPRKGTAVTPVYRVTRLDDEIIVQYPGAQWACQGWLYSAVQTFISRYAYDMEMQEHYSSIAAIDAFRQACKDSLPVDPRARLTLTRDATEAGKWNKDCYDRIATKLAAVIPSGPPPGTFCTTVAAILEAHAERDLRSLHCDQVVWHLDPAVPEPDTGKLDVTVGQLALF